MAKKTITAPAIDEKAENQLPEITGDGQKDLQAFRKAKSIDFGIQLLEHYVPQNRRLIDYCLAVRDKKYITENLNAILNGNN